MTSKSDGTNTWTWGYDYENRQISYDAPGTVNDATYGYDASGRRVSKTVNGVTEKYLFDGANVVADYDVANNPKAYYITPELDDNLYVNMLVDGSWQGYYFFHDGLGSVTNIINTSNVLKKNYQYYAFGEMLSETGNTLSNRYKFTGREWDAESGTYNYRSRQYNPTSGRFNQRDMYGYSININLYIYAKNNSINRIDPSGNEDMLPSIDNEPNHNGTQPPWAVQESPLCKGSGIPHVLTVPCTPAVFSDNNIKNGLKRWRTEYCTSDANRLANIKCPRFICPYYREGGCNFSAGLQDMVIVPMPCFEYIENAICYQTTGKMHIYEGLRKWNNPEEKETTICCELIMGAGGAAKAILEVKSCRYGQ